MPDRDWRSQGNCVGMNPDLFFEQSEASRFNKWPEEVRQACYTCPVQLDCLNWALHNEEYGFWGGMSPAERKQARRRMRIVLADAPTSTRNFISVAG